MLQDRTTRYIPPGAGYLGVGHHSRPVPYNCICAMPATLDSILAAARQRLFQRRHSVDLRSLERAAEEHVPRGFGERLRRASVAGIAVIAELKKASPSKGLIRADFQPAEL